MRMMMRCTVDVQAGNNALREGTMGKIIQAFAETVHPEAMYFSANQGDRVAFAFFDLKDVSDMPRIAEPLYMGLNAKIEFIPVMNTDELMAGLAKMQGQ